MSVLVVLALLAALAVVSAPPALAATFTVTTTTDANSGSCSAGACPSLRLAIDEANGNGNPGVVDVIQVPAGVYTLDVEGASENANVTGDLDIGEPVRIIGAGSGDDPAVDTIIDGNATDRVFDFKTGGVTLEGLRVRNGQSLFGSGINALGDPFGTTTLLDVAVVDNVVDGIDGVSVGTGITAAGDLAATDVLVAGNTADFGAAFTHLATESTGDSPSVELTRVVVQDNTSEDSSGLLFYPLSSGVLHAELVATDLTVEGNTATSTGTLGEDAGLIGVVASASLTRVHAEDNTAVLGRAGIVLEIIGEASATDLSAATNDSGTATGGGVTIADASSLVVDGVEVTGGTGSASTSQHGVLLDSVTEATLTDVVVSGSPGGSGLRVESSDVTIDGFAITDNDGTTGGGVSAVGSPSTTVHLRNGVVAGNRAEDGAGVAVEAAADGHVTLEDTQVSGNVATGWGGGVYVGAESSLEVFQSTVVDNRAVEGGGGIDATDGTAATVQGSIVADNLQGALATSGAPDQCSAPLTSDGDNLESHDQCGFDDGSDQVDTDPLLVERVRGDRTVLVPEPTSPAVDATTGGICGDDAVVLASGLQVSGADDLLGGARPVQGDLAAGAVACDVGAIEVQPSTVSIAAGDDGAEGGAAATFVLNRTAPQDGDLVVPLSYSGSASVSDVMAPASATLPDGAASVTVTVPVVDDDLVEGTETLTATIGTPLAALGAGDSASVDILDDDTPVDPGPPAVGGLAGDDRFETAAVLSTAAFPDGANRAIVARADEYADALAAGPLAAQLQAPVLLTRTGSVPDVTLAELDRLGVTEVIVAGGPGAVGEAVVTVLDDRYDQVRRIAGSNRFETAGLIGSELLGGAPPSTPGRAYVTEGINASPNRGWPDALSVAPVAATAGAPILLVSSTSAPTATLEALDDLGITEVVVIGGDSAVGPDVFAALEAAAGTAQRISGPDRYATSLAVAEHGLTVGSGAASTWFATGTGFADALVAGPIVALSGGSMLLINGRSADGFADAPAASWLSATADRLRSVSFIGGVGAVAQEVRDAVTAAVS